MRHILYSVTNSGIEELSPATMELYEELLEEEGIFKTKTEAMEFAITALSSRLIELEKKLGV